MINMTKDDEYRWMVRINIEDSEWLKSFLAQSTNGKNTKRLAWLRIVGLIETWDIS